MRKKAVQEMSEKEKRRHSLSAKTTHYTVVSCILFGVIIHVVALSFYVYAMSRQMIRSADSMARQTVVSATHGADAVSLSEQVMQIYHSVSEAEREQTGTDAYRALFSQVDRSEGSTYDLLLHMLSEALRDHDVFDVYIGMYDRAHSSLVYVVDADPDMETRLLPGEWEEVPERETSKFLDWDGNGILYDIGGTEQYGWLCTVGVPITRPSGGTCAFLLVDISAKDVISGMLGFALQLTAAVICVTILIAWMQTKRIKRNLVAPINTITDAAQRFASGNQEGGDCFADLGIHSGDEVENLANTMKNMECALKTYAENLLRITAEKERIGTELTLATKIQAAMLPHIFPPYPDRTEFDVYAIMEPAREVGGDFYDFFLIDDDHLCLIMADVSGKGIPAALFMMISKTILQSIAMLGKSAAEILSKTNTALCSNNQVEMFVTVWLGILEISTGKLIASNAGHEYPILKRKGGRFELFKDKHSLAVGGMEGMRYKEYEIQLEAGDQLFLYTDGVPEATSAEDEMFCYERMLKALNSVPEATPKDLLFNVRTAVGEFVKDAEQFDDLTMMCMEYKGKPQIPEPSEQPENPEEPAQ